MQHGKLTKKKILRENNETAVVLKLFKFKQVAQVEPIKYVSKLPHLLGDL